MTNGLTINNRHYNVIQLIELAEVMCNNANIPAWEMNIFRFIIDWFDGTPFITQKTSGSTGIAKEVINALLDKYTESGIESIEDISVLKVPPFNEYGTMKELTKLFGGGRAGYQSLIKEIEQHLYAS